MKLGINRRFLTILSAVIVFGYHIESNMHYHTHVVGNGVLAHSHPLGHSAHEHSAQALVGIDILSNYSAENINLCFYPEVKPIQLPDIHFAKLSVKLCKTDYLHSFTIRPPPQSITC